MADESVVTQAAIVAATPLSEAAVEAILGVLCSVSIVTKTPAGECALTTLGSEYFDRRSPFYIGPLLYSPTASVPPILTKHATIPRISEQFDDWRAKLHHIMHPDSFGTTQRLRYQHCRNFPAAVVAARNSAFDHISHLLDVGGGSGVFAIPLALDHPEMRITLLELPRTVPNLLPFLESHGVGGNVTALGWNAFTSPWPVADCDGVLFANFLHACDDRECSSLLNESFTRLSAGGTVFIHEMLWADRHKTGPLLVAEWNLRMMGGGGRQRSLDEFIALLEKANFHNVQTVPTAGYFSLITATK